MRYIEILIEKAKFFYDRRNFNINLLQQTAE